VPKVKKKVRAKKGLFYLSNLSSYIANALSSLVDGFVH